MPADAVCIAVKTEGVEQRFAAEGSDTTMPGSAQMLAQYKITRHKSHTLQYKQLYANYFIR